MKDFKKPKWRSGNKNADERADDLKKRFEGVSKRSSFRHVSYYHVSRRRKRAAIARQVLMMAGLLLTLALVIYAGAYYKGWRWDEMARHVASFPNCSAARAMRLAPAKGGEPGYYLRHDADQDGISCEPFPR